MQDIIDVSMNGFDEEDYVFQDVSSVVEIGPACTNYFAMTGVAFLFQSHCEKLVQSLSNEQLNNFKNASADMERIRLMYEQAIKLPVMERPDGKNLKDALDFKNYGNVLYQKKKLKPTLKEYNQGIVLCPVDNDDSKKLLSVLVANRSAVLYELNLFKECIEDVDWVLATKWYPKNWNYKILIRKGNSCAKLSRYEEAIVCLNEALKLAAPAKLPKEKIDIIHSTLNYSIERLGENVREENGIISTPIFTQFERNPLYPATSTAVSFKRDPENGRYAVATKDISAGVIILEEEAFCIAVSKDNTMHNCSHCGLSTLSPYPCTECASVVFCSMTCKEKAIYHQTECKILSSIYSSGASVNCLMSLRIVTQLGFDYFWTHRQEFNTKVENEVYDSKDYHRIYHLCTHSELRAKGEFLHYTFMAIFLLRLLKKTTYFPFEPKDEVLRDEEAYIGSLLLRHLQLLQFNAHELSEMRNCECGDIPYKNAHVGGAIYATLALFNHSCEPSIIRYNKGNKMIARTIKCIKAGDPIFENYGPIYCSNEIAIRQKKMWERYYFRCRCIPCMEKWPLYHAMDNDTLRLKCELCKGALIVGKNQDSPFVVCKTCKKKNNIMLASMKLMNVDNLTTQAEERFKGGDYEGAIKFYQAAMEFYHSYLVPPFQDMVKVQQRLRTCMLHDGNTEKLYKMPTEFLPLTTNPYGGI